MNSDRRNGHKPIFSTNALGENRRGPRDAIGTDLPTRTNGDSPFAARSANHDVPHQHMVLGGTEFRGECRAGGYHARVFVDSKGAAMRELAF